MNNTFFEALREGDSLVVKTLLEDEHVQCEF